MGFSKRVLTTLTSFQSTYRIRDDLHQPTSLEDRHGTDSP